MQSLSLTLKMLLPTCPSFDLCWSQHCWLIDSIRFDTNSLHSCYYWSVRATTSTKLQFLLDQSVFGLTSVPLCIKLGFPMSNWSSNSTQSPRQSNAKVQSTECVCCQFTTICSLICHYRPTWSLDVLCFAVLHFHVLPNEAKLKLSFE